MHELNFLLASDFAYIFLILPASQGRHKLPVPASVRNTDLSVAGEPCARLRIPIAPKSFRPISFPYFDYLAAVSFFG